MPGFAGEARRHPLVPALWMTAGVFAAAWAGIELTRESGRIASIWMANAVVLLALLKTAPRRWPWWLGCGLAGNLGANLITGDSSWFAAILSLSNTVEILLVAMLFRWRLPGRSLDLAQFRPVFTFLVVGGVLGPAASAAMAAFSLHIHGGLPFWAVFQTWYAADALGLLLIVPLFAGIPREELARLDSPRSRLEAAATLILVAATTLGIVGGGQFAWIFLLSPLFLWAAFRFGFLGVAVGIFFAAASGILTLAYGAHLGPTLHLRANIQFLQIFLFSNVVIFLPIASLLRALRASEAELRLLFEKAPIGLAIMESHTGRYLAVNPRNCEILGYPPETLLKSTFRDFTHPGHLEADLASVVDLVQGKVQEIVKEKRYLHKSGRLVWARLKMVPLPSLPGAPARHLSLIEDITEAREYQNLEAQLRQAQKMESLGILAGGVAHDMNNVLGAILSLASAHLLSHGPDDPTYPAIETIRDAAIRGGAMVKSLLSFARQTPIAKSSLDLNALIHEEARLLARTVPARITLAMDLAPELRPIHGDGSTLLHAFLNICLNAVDAMPAGGTLTFSTRNRDSDLVAVTVADTGSGMTPEVLAKAMDPFFTTKELGKGTGLGLAIVFTTIKAHGGRMEIHSEAGQGTARLSRPAPRRRPPCGCSWWTTMNSS